MWDWLGQANQNHVTVATWVIGLLVAFGLARYALMPFFGGKSSKTIY